MNEGVGNMSKDSIRKTILENLSKLDSEEREEIERSFQERLFDTKLWKESSSIGVTIGQGAEWNTKPIIEQAWKENKKVSVPKSIHESKKLHFYAIDSFDQVEKGYYDLQEPVPEKTSFTEPRDIELLLVPGLAFNEKGYRVGFGGGYYDRFTEQFPNKKISLIHTNQLVDNMPVEEHDIPVDYIITEKGIIQTKENR